MGQDIAFWVCEKGNKEIPIEIPHLIREGQIAFPINTESYSPVGNLIEDVLTKNDYDIRNYFNEDYSFLKLAEKLGISTFKVTHSVDYADIPVDYFEFTVKDNFILKNSILSSDDESGELSNSYNDDLYDGALLGNPISNLFYFYDYDDFIFQYKNENFMSYFMVDVEADGPIPGDYSMISFGVVLVDESLDKTFYGKLKPISEKFNPDALKVSGFTRQEILEFEEPAIVMRNFRNWITENSKGRPIFISDNNGFDFMFITWYFHHFLHHNPFGHSSQNLGSLYKGLVKDTFKNFKHLRETKHTHHPVDDALGNAEALIKLKNEFELKIKLE